MATSIQNDEPKNIIPYVKIDKNIQIDFENGLKDVEMDPVPDQNKVSEKSERRTSILEAPKEEEILYPKRPRFRKQLTKEKEKPVKKKRLMALPTMEIIDLDPLVVNKESESNNLSSNSSVQRNLSDEDLSSPKRTETKQSASLNFQRIQTKTSAGMEVKVSSKLLSPSVTNNASSSKILN